MKHPNLKDPNRTAWDVVREKEGTKSTSIPSWIASPKRKKRLSKAKTEDIPADTQVEAEECLEEGKKRKEDEGD